MHIFDMHCLMDHAYIYCMCSLVVVVAELDQTLRVGEAYVNGALNNHEQSEITV